MNFALVVINDLSDPSPPFGTDEDATCNAYWNKFIVIAECESQDAGKIRLGDPLLPILDKICEAISRGDKLLDLREEKLYINVSSV